MESGTTESPLDGSQVVQESQARQDDEDDDSLSVLAKNLMHNILRCNHKLFLSLLRIDGKAAAMAPSDDDDERTPKNQQKGHLET
jgi:hypothetical protein